MEKKRYNVGDGAAGNECRTKLFTDSNVLSAGRWFFMLHHAFPRDLFLISSIHVIWCLISLTLARRCRPTPFYPLYIALPDAFRIVLLYQLFSRAIIDSSSRQHISSPPVVVVESSPGRSHFYGNCLYRTSSKKICRNIFHLLLFFSSSTRFYVCKASFYAIPPEVS